MICQEIICARCSNRFQMIGSVEFLHLIKSLEPKCYKCGGQLFVERLSLAAARGTRRETALALAQ